MATAAEWESLPEALRDLISIEVDGGKIYVCAEASGEVTQIPYLIVDPVHCVVANHTHLPSSSICLSLVCSFLGDIPKGHHQAIFKHQVAPNEEEQKKGLYKEPSIDKAGQMCRYLAMSALMLMVKPLNENEANYEYLRKRWTAALAGVGISDQTNEKGAGPDCREILVEYNNYIQSHTTIKRAYIKLALMKILKGTTPNDDVTKALITQVKLVWEDYGLCTTKMMESIIDQNAPLLSCANVAEEAIALKKAIRNVKRNLGDLYPYAGVLGLIPDSLHNSKYPNLYNIVKVQARSVKSMSNFRWSDNITPTLSLVQMKKLLKTSQKPPLITEAQLAELQNLGLLIAETTTSLSEKFTFEKKSRKRRKTDSESEDSSD